MVHVAEQMQTLFICIDNLERDADRVPQLQFIEIANVNFGGEERAFPFLRVIPADIEFGEERVQGFIKKQIVVGHVHMTVQVNPLRFNLANRGFEGKGLRIRHGRVSREGT